MTVSSKPGGIARVPTMSDGRWPANVILSPEMAEALDQQSGYQRDGKAVNRTRGQRKTSTVNYANHDGQDHTYGSGGGASRFFLNAGYEPWEMEWIYKVGLRPCGHQEEA